MTFAKHLLFITSVSALLLLSSCRQSTSYTQYVSQKVATSDKSMIVAAHPLAVDAGIDILSKGGNAVDAMVAVQFALAVVYPRAGNIGGGGFMLYDEKGKETVALDFREKAPFAATTNMYLDSLGNPIPGLSTKGALAVGVPGSVDGLLQALEKYGKLKDRKMVMQRAIDLARQGFAISQKEAERLNRFAPDFKALNPYDFPFVKETKWNKGDLIQQSQLAQTLQTIQNEGRKGFYEGDCAAALIQTMTENNGIIAQRDLNRYKAKWKKPIQFSYKGYDIASMPLPSSGGIVLMQILKILEPYPLDSLGFQTAESIHLISEAERSAYEVRAKHLGDSDFYNVPEELLLSDNYISIMGKDIDLDKARKSQSDGNKATQTLESFQTTHTSIIDNEGNSASLTTTLNSNYGSKLYVKEAGFFLNNEMDDFSVKPGVPNTYGLVGAKANEIAPEKRMLSSMTPTIVKKDGEPFLVLGAPGGSTIITAVLQVLLNKTVYGQDLEAAVNACRTHHQWLPDRILIEKDCLSEQVRNALKAKGHQLDETQYMAIIKAIHRATDGTLTGVGDRRNPDDHAQGL